ncbi:hypothetical protein [Cellulomonas sp.]|uniref:hypothetical protein n=1 Tax=Cellulomonas sp. TaxID=40001 RepID=UPI001B009AE5|nr:hypothetical protein [Cellulomonas sp.]MBO9553208.1 hypothetical protein [Cellulomonas sp.]
MNDLAGPVALALVGLWVAYLVPHKLRYRQQLLESRADDRFSEALRVVAVTRRRTRRGVPVHVRSADSTDGTATGRMPGLLTPGKGLPVLPAGSATGGTTVDRPTATESRITAEAARRAAQARAARAASVARRAAAARRRGLLAGILVVATVVGWTVAGIAPAVTWVAGAVPTALLTGVVVLGRRAVLAGRAADAAWEARVAEERRAGSAPRTGATRVVAPAGAPSSRPITGATPRVPERRTAPSSTTTSSTTTSSATTNAAPTTAATTDAPHALVTGRAVHPSDARTEVFAAIVADHGEPEAETPARHAATGGVPVVRLTTRAQDTSSPEADAEADEAASDEAWSPVPVPRPTYTMKATAPRREPAPLDNLEGSTAVRATEQTAAPEETTEVVEPVAETTGSIDLNAVLAKRRAAGE